MAQHKKKKPPQQQNYSPNAAHAMKAKRVILVAVIFFLLFGVGIAFFAAGNNINWLIGGGVIGAVGGYFFGNQIVKGLTKNK